MTYTEPLVLVFLVLGLASLFWLRRRMKPCSLAEPAAAFLGLFAVSWMPLAWLLAQPFEAWYPRRAAPEGGAEAIVVLAGDSLEPRPERPYAAAGRQTYLRTLHAAWLHKNWSPLPVLASGGGNRGEPFAVTMARILQAEGVPRGLVWEETNSTSTYENALYSARILKDRGISRVALVTSAVHMPRSEKAFRKQGLSVLAAPCCFTGFNAADLVPGWKGIRQNEANLHEGLGLVWYWMRGRL